ncbi:hypothetical protein PV382_14335 [Streptomyces scabiei]|nr:hypothetical protein [Streptomyces scabiei]MDX3173464.1 hypothetical protein [Streptomyces scabiei]MDX3268541.1 hypothetical protein [Streptomyces scabiei]MDX3394663.1 hypothetical protein [Streptomyces scabiei]
MTVAGKVQCAREVGLDRIEGGRGRAEPSLDSRELVGDALLLAGDEIHRHRTAVDRFEQLLTLRGELRFLGHQMPVLVFGFLAVGGKFASEPLLDGVAEFGGKPDAGPVVFDHLLDLGDEQRLARAAGRLLVSPQTHKVRVDHAVAVLGVGDDQSAAAVAAEDAGLEVVRVVALSLTDEVGSEDVLNFLPGDQVGKRRVAAGVDDAPIHDLTPVVGIGQDAVQDVGPDRARRHLGGPLRGEPPGFQLVGQRPKCPRAAREGFECPADQLGTLGVHLYRALLAPFGCAEYDVQVAEWSLARGATGLGLLAHPLVHLGGEVAGVELRDGRHDAVEQHPGGGLVDVFRRGDQSRAGLLDRQSDLDVVHAVPCQAIHLVDEHVVDGVFCEVAQHPLEVGPVC